MTTCIHSSYQCCFAIIIYTVLQTKPLGVFAMHMLIAMLNITTTYKVTITGIASRMIPAIRPPINAPASPPELLASVELSHEGVQT